MQHAAQRAYDRTRESPSKRGYDRRWKRLRRWFLIRHSLCEECKRNGVLTVATEVDHIKPLSQGGERLDPANLQALCKPCHSRKTGREKHHHEG